MLAPSRQRTLAMGLSRVPGCVGKARVPASRSASPPGNSSWRLRPLCTLVRGWHDQSEPSFPWKHPDSGKSPGSLRPLRKERWGGEQPPSRHTEQEGASRGCLGPASKPAPRPLPVSSFITHLVGRRDFKTRI